MLHSGSDRSPPLCNFFVFVYSTRKQTTKVANKELVLHRAFVKSQFAHRTWPHLCKTFEPT